MSEEVMYERCGLCARMITAIEDEGMMAKQWLGGVDCFGTRRRVCCLSAVAYCLGFALSLSFTHSLTYSLPNLGTSRDHTGRHSICSLSASSAEETQPFRGNLRPRSVVSTASVWFLHRCYTRLDPIQSDRDRNATQHPPHPHSHRKLKQLHPASSKSCHPQSQQQSSSSRSFIRQPPFPSRSATPATRSPRAPSSSSSCSARGYSSAWVTPYTRPLDSEETLMSSDT